MVKLPLKVRQGLGTDSANFTFQQHRKEGSPNNEPHDKRTGNRQLIHHLDYHFRGDPLLEGCEKPTGGLENTPARLDLSTRDKGFKRGQNEHPNDESVKGGENGRDKKNGIQPGKSHYLDTGLHQRVFPLDADYEVFLTGDGTSLSHLTNFDKRLNSSVPASLNN